MQQPPNDPYNQPTWQGPSQQPFPSSPGWQPPPYQPQMQVNPNPSMPVHTWNQPPGPPPQPPKKRRRWPWLIGMLIAALVLCIVVSVATANSPQTTQQPAQTTAAAVATATAIPKSAPTATNTPTPRPQPTAKPTSMPQSTLCAPILGAYMNSFIAAYGQPNHTDGSVQSRWNNGITVDLAETDGWSMVVSQDITSDNHLFTFNEARNICHRFLPGDATYIHKHQTIYYPNNGGPEIEQYVYYSPNLANQFPASMFTDENGNQGKPGIIGLTMDYDAGSSTQFVDCGVQVGLQSN